MAHPLAVGFQESPNESTRNPGQAHGPPTESVKNVIDGPTAVVHIATMNKQRKLIDLVSVGPAFLGVFDDLGITEVEHLIDKDARDLYDRMQEIKGQRPDPCCEDVFRAAIEQAKDPNLPDEKRIWHYWSKVRKGTV